MSEPKARKQPYKTTNWPTYNAALKAKGSLTIWLDKDMQWYASASRKRGRQAVLPPHKNEERQAVERDSDGSGDAQRSPGCLPEVGTRHLE